MSDHPHVWRGYEGDEVACRICGTEPRHLHSEPSLFNVGPWIVPSKAERAFTRFHEANPSVYTELVAMADELQQAGRERIGIGMLWEVLRWQRFRTSGGEFKLNNSYRSWYARIIMENEPRLDGIFQLREMTSE